MIKAVQQFMLGTVLNNEQEAKNTLKAIAEAGYNGIELCHFMIQPISPIVRILTQAAGMPVGKGGKLDWHKLIETSGLQVISLHMELDTLEKDIIAAANLAKSFGTRYIVITGVYNYDFGDLRAVTDLVNRLNNAGSALAEEKISLLYHNHNCELRNVTPDQKAYEILIAETNPAYVNFEFDSYWFAEAGADPVLWMNRLGNRMKLWHINDRGYKKKGKAITPIIQSDSMELGTGNMPLDALMECAKSLDVEAVILERHRNWIDNNPIKSFQCSALFLNRHIGRS